MSSALRVLAGAGLSSCEPRKEQLLAGPQKVGYVLVPENSSRVKLRPGFLHVLCCSQPQIKIASVFLFLGVKKRSVAGGSLFLFDSQEQGRRIWSRAGRADLAFGSLPLTRD